MEFAIPTHSKHCSRTFEFHQNKALPCKINNPSGKNEESTISFFRSCLLECLWHKKNGHRKGDATTVNKKKVELKYNSFYVIFNLSFLRINSFISVRFLAACAKPEHPDG